MALMRDLFEFDGLLRSVTFNVRLYVLKKTGELRPRDPPMFTIVSWLYHHSQYMIPADL